VFTSLRGLNNYDVLACIDLQTRQWSIVDFSPQFGYDNISLFYEKQLVIKTEHYDKGLNKHRFYKLSVGYSFLTLFLILTLLASRIVFRISLGSSWSDI
jgi:hypothetical protein